MKRAPGSYEGLTEGQAELLSFIRNFIAKHDGVAPTFREMMVGTNLDSMSSITWILKGLEERGYIERYRRRPRAIRVFDCPPPKVAKPSQFKTETLVAELKRRGFRFAGAWA